MDPDERLSELSAEVLREWLDDWVPLAAVCGWAGRLGARSDGEAERMSIATVGELVEQGLVVLGEVSDGGFTPSREPLEQSLARLEGVGQVEERDRRGFGCWLSNTRRGDARARRLPLRAPDADAEDGNR